MTLINCNPISNIPSPGWPYSLYSLRIMGMMPSPGCYRLMRVLASRTIRGADEEYISNEDRSITGSYLKPPNLGSRQSHGGQSHPDRLPHPRTCPRKRVEEGCLPASPCRTRTRRHRRPSDRQDGQHQQLGSPPGPSSSFREECERDTSPLNGTLLPDVAELPCDGGAAFQPC